MLKKCDKTSGLCMDAAEVGDVFCKLQYISRLHSDMYGQLPDSYSDALHSVQYFRVCLVDGKVITCKNQEDDTELVLDSGIAYQCLLADSPEVKDAIHRIEVQKKRKKVLDSRKIWADSLPESICDQIMNHVSQILHDD